MAFPEREAQLREIGERIKERRRELGMTQEQLRLQAELSKSFLSEIETGSTAASGLNYLRIAEVLDVDVQWILTGAHATAPADPRDEPVLPLVSTIADEEGWSHKKAVTVSKALRVVVARRTRSGVPFEPDRNYILRFAEAVGEDEP